MLRASFAVLIAALVAAPAPSAAPQRPAGGRPEQPSARGLIVGQVIDAHTGRAVPGAVVSLTGGPGGSSSETISAPPGFGLVPDGPAGQRRVLATADGRFVFRDLAPGAYNVTARKSGHIEGAHGRRTPFGAARSVVLAEGERVADIDIAMWKHAAISGTVIDEAGEPVVGIEVRAMRRTIVAGRRRFNDAGRTQTDDRGMYRLPMLAPGDHIIAIVSTQVAVPASTLEDLRRALDTRDTPRTAALRAVFEAGASAASPGASTAVQVGDMVRTVARSHMPPPPAADGTVFVYPTMFFPSGGASDDANLVGVTSGEDRNGVDFQLKPVPATQIAGQVFAPDGPAQGVVVRLVSGESNDFSTELDAATTVTAGDGSFTFLGVPAGTYVLQVQRTPRPVMPNAPTTIIQSGNGMMIMTSSPGTNVEPQYSDEPMLWARVPITVEDRPQSGIEIALQTVGRIRGRVVFDGAASRPRGEELTRIAVRAETAEGRSPRVPPMRVDRLGSFTSTGLPNGKYLLSAVGAPPGWTFKGAMLEGRDVSDLPLELGSSDVGMVAITFTDSPAALTGTVRTPQGAPDPDATVLVFPAEARMWTEYGAMGRRFRSARAGKSGAYNVSGLPPGSYAVIALPDELTADWQDPARLEALARQATRVQIEDKQSRTQDLTSER